MSNEKSSQPKIWNQIPENFSDMNDEEIDRFTQSLWQEITQQLGVLMNRKEKLRLLQLAYKRWIDEFPDEAMDQIDCHLPFIQAHLGLPSRVTGLEDIDF